MKTTSNLILLAAVALLFVGCAGMTAAETTGVVTTGAGALAAFITALKPMLTPEQIARLSAIASSVQTTTDALSAAVGAIADAVAQVRAQAADAKASAWTSSDVATMLGGTAVTTGAGTLAAIRAWRGSSATTGEKATRLAVKAGQIPDTPPAG